MINTQFHRKSYQRVLCFILMKDILYKKYNCCMESYTTTSKPSTNTSTCDPRSIKVQQIYATWYHSLQTSRISSRFG